MNSIKAIWTNGRIVPTEPANWPEGTELLVKIVSPSPSIGLDESQWDDSPEAIADWEARVHAIEPLEYTDEERETMAQFEEKFRRYNIEAVRKQMGLEDSNDSTP